MTTTPINQPFSVIDFDHCKPCASVYVAAQIKPIKTRPKMNKEFTDLLGHTELLKLAAYHEQQYRTLKMQAAELKDRTERRRSGQRKRQQWEADKLQLIRVMTAQMEDGKNFIEAVEFGAQHSGKDAKTCETLLKRFAIDRRKEARQARKVLVIKHAQAGWTNDEIAKELGVHRNTVSKDMGEIMKSRISHV